MDFDINQKIKREKGKRKIKKTYSRNAVYAELMSTGKHDENDKNY